VNRQTDTQLLRAYAECHSDSAFAELVRRHIDLVHSAAMRMVGDSHLAQDVTQGVFVALARHAPQLADRPVLAGWLHGTAQNIAAQTVRTDVRRRAREQEAAVMNELFSTNPDASWEHIAPHLDEALGELSEPDREAVLLRYFKDHDLRTIGATLGISDDAAQKRVCRAVERLREFFNKRGITVGTSGLAVVVSANAVQAAPIGLALTISTAVALTGTTLATIATVTATKAIAMTALQKTVVTATIAVLAGAGIYEGHQASRLRGQVQTLKAQQAEQTERLQTERDEMSRHIAALREDNERLKRDAIELLKLRGQVNLLRKQSDELKSLREKDEELQLAAQAGRSNRQGVAMLKPVSKVVVTPLSQFRAISEEQIRTNISFKVGDGFNRAVIDLDVENLYATGLFRNVRVVENTSAEGIALNYLVQEKPRLSEISFAGNTKFYDVELAKVLSSKIGGLLDERTLSSDAQKIQEAYVNSGSTKAKVKYSLRENEDLGEGEVTFEINE
jgi:RNA polymerase sigma factor (sigma-70 family)